MDIAKLRRLIIRHEGIRQKPYRCTAGKLTIGVGRNLDDVGITHMEAIYLLNADLIRVCKELERFPWARKLDEVRAMVVISMLFNLGLVKFKGFKKMIAALEVGNYSSAATEMLASKWASQVGKRAVELAAMMRTGNLPSDLR